MISGFVISEKEIFLNGGREENWFLANVADDLSEPDHVDLSEIDSIDKDSSLVGVIESHYELQNCGLSTAGLSDQGCFVEIEAHREVVQNYS